jgi:uncharacterized protein
MCAAKDSLSKMHLLPQAVVSTLVPKSTVTSERPLVLWSFFGLTFIWSWTFWFLSHLASAKSITVSASLSLIASYGPSITAAGLVLCTRGSPMLRQWLKKCLRFRVGWRWIVLAIMFPLVVMSSVAVCYVTFGGKLVPSFDKRIILLAPVVFVGVFFVGGPLGEEFGWRSYALSIMQKRYGWRFASIAIGFIWGIWHLPLFYLANTSQSQTTIPIFMSMIMALSIIFSWLFNRTEQSVVPVLALHTCFNAWAFLTPILPSDHGQKPSEVAVGIFVVIAMVLLLKRDGAFIAAGNQSNIDD